MQDKVYILPSREPSKLRHTTAHNLPAQLTPLVGREREVAMACTLLRRPEVRLLTIVGTGGIGKTRLGLQVAADLLDEFSDGVYLVLLASSSDPELVISTISQTLGVKEVGARPLLDLLKDHLQDKDLLLVLDNFEQVVVAAPVLTELLESCPTLKLLVTSRGQLRVRGEQAFPLTPLALPDLKHLSVQGLLARLEHRLQLLTQGSRDVHVRQQTLRNTIQWSYDLLSDQEQRLFRRLSVFVGGCAFEAAEALYRVLNGETMQVVEGVTSLIDKSLLQQSEQDENSGDELRFAMLETIREYGLDCLAKSGEREVIQEAHAAYFLRLAETAEPELRGPQQEVWFDRLEREHDNLRAAMHFLLERDKGEMALRLGGALYGFWFVRAYSSEGWTFLERALATSNEVAESVRAKAFWVAGNLAGILGNVDRAEVLCKQSVAMFQEIEDKAGTGTAYFFLGLVVEWKSQPVLARSLYEKSLALVRESGDNWIVGWALHKLAQMSLYEGDSTRCCLLAEESLACFRKAGDKRGMCSTLGLLAWALFSSQGDAAKAQVLAEESLAISKEIGYKGDEGRALSFLGDLFDHQGKTEMARLRLEESLAIWNESGDKEGMGEVIALLARVEAHKGNGTAARTLYEQSLTLTRDIDPSEIASRLEGLAGVVAAQGELACAGQLWGAAEALREAEGVPILPVYRAEYEHGVASARETLGEQAFTAVWAQGRSMTPQEALAAEGRVVFPQPMPIEPSSTLPAKSGATYPDGLTAREVEVLRLIAQGLTDTRIAEQLIISPRTVNTHLTSIYFKIQVSSRSAATRYAMEHHLI